MRFQRRKTTHPYRTTDIAVALLVLIWLCASLLVVLLSGGNNHHQPLEEDASSRRVTNDKKLLRFTSTDHDRPFPSRRTGTGAIGDRYSDKPFPPVNARRHPAESNVVDFVVMVVSAASNSKRRAVIRETWGQNQTVYFVLGKSSSEAETASVAQEMSLHQDVLLGSREESYSNLPCKLLFGAHTILRRFSSVRWILKADDDMFVRVDLLRKLLSSLNANQSIVLGNILTNKAVKHFGKWNDSLYDEPIYPTFPQGSCGYVMSASIANCLAQIYETASARGTSKAALFVPSRGEDTSLGIWLDKSPSLKVQWKHAPRYFVNDGQCRLVENGPKELDRSKLALVVGHKLTTAHMKRCWDEHTRHYNMFESLETTKIVDVSSIAEIDRTTSRDAEYRTAIDSAESLHLKNERAAVMQQKQTEREQRRREHINQHRYPVG